MLKQTGTTIGSVAKSPMIRGGFIGMPGETARAAALRIHKAWPALPPPVPMASEGGESFIIAELNLLGRAAVRV